MWMVRFEHVLVDQSQARPEALRRELQGQAAQSSAADRCVYSPAPPAPGEGATRSPSPRTDIPRPRPRRGKGLHRAGRRAYARRGGCRIRCAVPGRYGASMPAVRDLHDASRKRCFDHPRMVCDLLRGFVPPEVLGVIDFDTLEALSADYVGDDLHQMRGDRVWRVQVRGARSQEWLYVLVLLEFQSTVDRHMALRVLAYTGQMYMKLLHNEAFPADERLPPVLPVVLYNGQRRWRAAQEVSETVAVVGAGLAPFQPRQRYLLIDEQALEVEDLPSDNVVSAQIALERRFPDVGRVLDGLAKLLEGTRYEGLRRAFGAWVEHSAARVGLTESNPELVAALKELAETGDLSGMKSRLAEQMEEFAETHRVKGLEQGLERGKAEGLAEERALLSRQTARKFGAGTAARVAEILEGLDDPERLAEIGEQVIDCGTGAELLARMRRASRRD